MLNVVSHYQNTLAFKNDTPIVETFTVNYTMRGPYSTNIIKKYNNHMPPATEALTIVAQLCGESGLDVQCGNASSLLCRSTLGSMGFVARRWTLPHAPRLDLR